MTGEQWRGEVAYLASMHQFNRSIHYTCKLYKVDIQQSLAYATALHRVGILSEHEVQEMQRGLRCVEAEWDNGTVSFCEDSTTNSDHAQFEIQPDDEDIFTANERRLSEIVGPAIGGKIHTGRSRNDQTATDTRLWLVSILMLLLMLISADA